MFKQYCLFMLLIVSITSVMAEERASDENSSEAIISFPEKLSFWNVTEGESRTKTLYLRQMDKTPFTVKEITSSSELVSATIKEKSGRESVTYAIDVELKGGFKPGAIEEMITITTDHPDRTSLKVPVMGNVLNGLSLNPAGFGLRLAYPARKAVGVLQIESIDKKPFEIAEISASIPQMKAEAVPMESCCGYFLWVYVHDPDFAITRPQRSTLHIKTTSDQELLVIPVSINVQR